MLTNISNYFQKATNNEELAFLCVETASKRYLKLKATGKLSNEQLSLAAIRISVNVHNELGKQEETPWSESLALKVSTLSEKYQEVVNLHIEGNSLDEIANKLGVSVATATGRYRRALTMLAA